MSDSYQDQKIRDARELAEGRLAAEARRGDLGRGGDVYLVIEGVAFLLTAPSADGTKSYERRGGDIFITVTASELEGFIAKAEGREPLS